MIFRRVFLLFCTGVLALGSAWAQEVLVTGVEDQVAAEVTVYNNGLGLIKDVREIYLPVGRGALRFADVASHIQPVTVHAKSLNAPEKFSVLEQNYEYDLMDPAKLLDKYVGKKIKLVDWNRFQDRKEVIEAVLLSNNNGPIYKVGQEIYIGHPGYRVLPEIPEDLMAKPTLVWLYENRAKSAHEVEVSYLTGGITWSADYIVIIDTDDVAADVSGWVTIDNRSGATYRNAGLKLVAGVVGQVANRSRNKAVFAMDSEKVSFAPQFSENPFFEYHIYDLQRQTTLKNNQTKQIRLLEASGVEIVKELVVSGSGSHYRQPVRGEGQKQPVGVFIEFVNTKENRLGMPFPGGVLRIYKKDQQGSLQFVGEDRADHTPAGEKIRIKSGEAFDVMARRVQMDYRKISSRLHETEWQIRVKNHKKEPISVGIVEPVPGNWEMVASSHPHVKKDAGTIRFDVIISPGKEAVVSYRVRVGI
jgi:hypothetical protein